MNLTLHASGSVQIGEGQPPAERHLSMDVQMLPPDGGLEVGVILLTIKDALSSTFTLNIKLTAMQAAQLGYQLCDLAQDAQHARTAPLHDRPLVVLPDPAIPASDSSAEP